MPLNPHKITKNPYSKKWKKYNPADTILSNTMKIAEYISSHQNELGENYWWLTGYMADHANFDGESILNDSISPF